MWSASKLHSTEMVFIKKNTIRPCQIGILLSVNSSLTNLGTYSQKHTDKERKHNYFTTKTMHYIYISFLRLLTNKYI